MQGWLASTCRTRVLSAQNASAKGRSVVGGVERRGVAQWSSVNAAKNSGCVSGWKSSFYGAQWHAKRGYLGSRKYCTVMVEDEDDVEELPEMTDDDLMTGTVEAHGFLILGDNEVKVDIEKWEKITETAFNQMRYQEAVSAYEHIRGVGPRAAEMSELHMRALDYIGSREDDIITSYRNMRERGVKILSHSYAKVLKSLFRRGEKKRVISVFELMQSEGTPGTAEVYSVLLTLYYQENPKDIETAVGILETMKANKVKPDIDVIDRVLLFFSEAGRTDLITDTYKEYIQNGSIKPERIINTIMAETMLLEGRPEIAKNFIQKLYGMHKWPRSRTYELMIDHYLQKGQKKLADEMLAEMKHSAKYSATLEVYKSFFRYYDARHDYVGMCETLSSMVVESVAPDAEVFECLLEVYYANGKNDEFMATFISMLDRQMLPSRHLWTYRMHLIHDDPLGGDMVTLLKEYEYMLQVGLKPTEEELRLIVSSMHRNGRPDLVDKFCSEELIPAGLHLDGTDYAMQIRNYAGLGNLESATEAYHKFITSGIVYSEPHVIYFQTMLEEGNADEALQVLDTILKSVTASTKDAPFQLDDTQAPRLIDMLAQTLGPDGLQYAQQVFETCLTHSKPAITVDLFDVMIRYLASCSAIEQALAQYRTMQSSYKIGPSIGIYLCLLQGLARVTEKETTTKYLTTAFELFRTLVSDPVMHPLDSQLVSTFLLLFMRHANHEGFSHALNWYKTLGGAFDAKLGQVEGAALRKWALSVRDPNIFVPAEFEERDYGDLELNLPSPTELQWQSREL